MSRCKKFIPGTDSGTFDYFVEEVYDEDSEPILSASNLQLSEDDNILCTGRRRQPLRRRLLRLRVLRGGGRPDEGVEALRASRRAQRPWDNGTYPLARPLFMYSTAEIMQSKPQVAAFLAFSINNATEAMRAVGYFKTSDEALENAEDKWLSATEGAY